MSVKNLVRNIERRAGCTTRERTEKVVMREKLVVIPRDTDVWLLLED